MESRLDDKRNERVGPGSKSLRLRPRTSPRYANRWKALPPRLHEHIRQFLLIIIYLIHCYTTHIVQLL